MNQLLKHSTKVTRRDSKRQTSCQSEGYCQNIAGVNMYIANLYLYTTLLCHFGESVLSRDSRTSSTGTIQLTDAQKMDILNLHNDMRRSSGSSNMRYMTWDSQLAWIAETYGRKCRYEHNEERQHQRYISVGENIYASNLGLAQFEPTRAVQMWFDEVADFDYKTRTCRTGKPCGHYTQIVWATTFKVGCALTACAYLSEIQLTDGLLFICNYATSGNVVNRNNKLYKIFEKGPACSKCDKTDYCRDSLCANSKRDFVEMPTPDDPNDVKSGLIVAVVVLSVVIIALLTFIIYRDRRKILPSRFTANRTHESSNAAIPGETMTVEAKQLDSPSNAYVMQRLLADETDSKSETSIPPAVPPTVPKITRKAVVVKPRLPPPSVPAPVLAK